MRKALLLTLFGLGLLSVNSCTSSTPTATATAPTGGPDTGTVTIDSKSIAVGIGVSWGDGTLQYRGQSYSFSVDGLSVLDLGISRVSAAGNVANLKRLEDFNGNYVQAGAGAVVGGGVGAAVLRNQNGVEISLTATSQGVRFALSSSGVNIKLK